MRFFPTGMHAQAQFQPWLATHVSCMRASTPDNGNQGDLG